MMGLAVAIDHPGLPTCIDCQTWVYDTKSWKKETRGGQPIDRPPGTPTPCHSCPKSIDKKTPNPDAELSAKNWRAYQFYLQVKAGAPMPDDSLSRYLCGLVRWVEDQAQRARDLELRTLVGAALGVGMRR